MQQHAKYFFREIFPPDNNVPTQKSEVVNIYI